MMLPKIIHDMRKVAAPSSVTDERMVDTTESMLQAGLLEAELRVLDDAMARAEEIQLTVGGDYAKELLNRACSAAYCLEDSLGALEALARVKADLGPATTRIRSGTHHQLAALQGQASGVIVSAALNRKELFYGRKKEEKDILDLLLKKQENDLKVKVINISGEPGVGKTALAALIYSNAGVINSFQLRVWVTLPHEGASVCEVVEKILNTVLGSTNDNQARTDHHHHHLQLLLLKLKMCFSGRKFLLVLDNCRIKDPSENWDKLIGSLGLNGSAIITLTGRGSREDDEEGLFVPPADLVENLSALPLCHSILLEHASNFMLAGPPSDEHDFIENDTEVVAMEIVNKLGNLPLAAKMVGSFLRDKLPDEWDQTLNDKLLSAMPTTNSSHNIPSFLIMCYLDLPGLLRRCFTSLSVFPKGYQFQRKQVVLLWMALGLLRQSRQSGRSLEEVGDEYFNYLTLRSFFQRLGDDGVSFTIHDMVHDLASCMLRDQESCENQVLYHGTAEGLSRKVPNPFSLRSIWLRERAEDRLLLPAREVEVEKVLSKLNPNIFRVLSLPKNITELPSSIGRLTYLHYLDLSHTALKVLPDSVGDLYFLQTLLLTNCTSLTSLPESLTSSSLSKRMNGLANLRHLDIRGTGVQEMPPQMNRLTSLQTLTDFVVSRSSESGRLEDLAGLSNIKTLAISNLHNLADATDASCAKLKEKRSLNDLTLRWGGSGQDHHSKIGSQVLENLVPHTNVKHLAIEHYGGVEFPSWLGGELIYRFKSLRSVKLRHCNYCCSLPPLGQLQGLKDLVIEGFHEITHIGAEFCGDSKAFRSLESLQFRDMLEWKDWKILEDVEFPNLRELSLVCCPKLVGELPKILVSLERLEISGCYKLLAALPTMKPSCEVYVHDNNETLKERAKAAPNSSRRLVVPADGKQSGSLEAQSHELEADHDPKGFSSDNSQIGTSSSEDERSSIEMLRITNISQLEKEKLPAKLDSLRIEDCTDIDTFPESLLPRMKSLQELYLIDCYSFGSFPPLEFPIPLTTLYVSNCPKLELSPTQMFGSLENLCKGNSCDSLRDFTLNIFPKLRTLSIWECSSLASLTVSEEFQGDLACLESLEIRDCSNLKSFPARGLPTPNMASILVSNCKILNNIPNSMKSLCSLQSLVICDCPALESDSLDALPSTLTSLSIASCDKLTPQKSWGMQSLQKLTSFAIEGGCMDMKSFPKENLLPSNINTLRISKLQSLEKLDYKGFEHLKALQALEIDDCKQLQSIPEEGLPSSLLYLSIKGSPLLTQKLTSKTGNEWSKVAHIPQIEIDGEVIC